MLPFFSAVWSISAKTGEKCQQKTPHLVNSLCYATFTLKLLKSSQKKNSWNCKSEKRVDFWTTNISCDWKEITAWRRFNLQILLWIKKIYLIFSVYFYFCTSSKISTGRDYNLSRQLSLFVVIFSSALKLPNHNFWFFFSIPIIVKLVIFFSPNLLM